MKGLGLAVMLVGATSMSAYADILLLEAIEAARAQQQLDPAEDHDIPGGPDGSGGSYVM